MDIRNERAVLGAILLEPGKTMNIVKRYGLRPEWFMDTVCRSLWQVIDRLATEGKPIDPVIAWERMGREFPVEAQSATMQGFKVDDCIDACATSAHMLYYISVLRDQYRRTCGMEILTQGIADIRASEDLDETMSKIRFDLSKIQQVKPQSKSNDEVVSELKEQFKTAKQFGFSGVPSRWFPVQTLIGGYPHGKITIVAGRPKQGKTTYTINESLFLAKEGFPVGIISLEMNAGEILGNMAGDHANINMEHLRGGMSTEEEFERFSQAAGVISELPIYIVDHPQTISSLCVCARDLVENKKCRLIVIDYIQLIKSEGKQRNRQEEVAGWSNALTNLAKELNETSFIIVSQLSRQMFNEQKEGKKEPELHHLRDSGSLEQDAYMVLFVYQNPDAGEENIQDDAPTIIKVGARRGGKTGSVNLIFQKSRQRFETIQQHAKDQRT